MLAHNGQGRFQSLSPEDKGEAGSQTGWFSDAGAGKPHRDYVLGGYLGPGRRSEGDDTARPGLSGVPQEGIVPVDDHRSPGAQPPKEVSLLRRHPRQVGESFQMGEADVGDQGDVRCGNPGKPGDLSGGVSPQLQDGAGVVAREAEQCQGQADEVVEVPLRFQDRSAPRHNGGDHLLGGGFPGAAGDGDDRGGEAPAPPRRQLPQGRQGIGDNNDGHPSGRRRGQAVDEESRRPLPVRRLQIVVAIEVRSREGDKEVARRAPPGVRGDSPEDDLFLRKTRGKGSPGGRQDLGKGYFRSGTHEGASEERCLSRAALAARRSSKKRRRLPTIW